MSFSLKLCADKLALRPVYVFLDETLCVFSTNIRTLRSLIARPLDLDEQGLGELVFLGQPLGSRTIYRNVKVLRPAEILTITPTSATSERYFDWNHIQSQEFDEASACTLLYQGFILAIGRRSRHTLEDAFLSGGMDSRCVVAGLLDIGRDVRTFASSFPQSANDVISSMVAEAFGTAHTAHQSDPAERLKSTMVRWGIVARDHFPSGNGSAVGRVIFGGHGGSVGMGHVYMDERTVQLATKPLTDAVLFELFPRLLKRGTRLFDRTTDERLRKLAAEGLKSELAGIEPERKERKLFNFYLLNDQARHSYEQFEDIDLSQIEIVNPFLDPDFLSIVVAAPVGMFLHHHLYNRWLTYFRAPAASLPWQVYPGHEPGPHTMPAGVVSQWSNEWYSGAQVRRLADKIAGQILDLTDVRVQQLFSRLSLLSLRSLNALGIERYNYELTLGRAVYEAITGEPIDG